MPASSKRYLDYCNSLILETTQISSNRWMDEQIMVYSYNGIPLSNRKEETANMRNHKDESQKHCAGGIKKT